MFILRGNGKDAASRHPSEKCRSDSQALIMKAEALRALASLQRLEVFLGNKPSSRDLIIQNMRGYKAIDRALQN